MRRQDLEHLIAAAADVTGESELVVIGSQAILGTYPDAPASMLRSQEADLYPAAAPEKADEIDGALGDGSQFHRTMGYFAHGVGPETAKAPAGWRERLVRIEVAPRMPSQRPAAGLCLEPHDLVLAKCAAGREHDVAFAREAMRHGLVDPSVLLERVPDLPLGQAHRAHVNRLLRGIRAELRTS